MNMELKAKEWNGERLEGWWDVSYKIDGIQAVVELGKNGKALSRKGKPLFNVPRLAPGIYEIFSGSWEESMTACRTEKGAALIPRKDIYMLWPKIDPRLVMTCVENPTALEIKSLLRKANKKGYEGIMLKQNGIGGVILKVKPKLSLDVKVLGWKEGTGRNKGRLGALITERGDVGTGFNDEQRNAHLKLYKVGTVIEVECMELTPGGKFRQPRFKRVREDK
jgi:hypothetical protein